MTTPEGKVKAKVKTQVIDKLARRYAFWPVQVGMGATTLDCLMCINGYFVAIETKAQGKKLTPRQEAVAALVRNAGGMVYVVTPDTDLPSLLFDIKNDCLI